MGWIIIQIRTNKNKKIKIHSPESLERFLLESQSITVEVFDKNMGKIF